MRSRGLVPTPREKSVFVNCPFDEDYHPLLRPLLFTIVNLDFTPRIALERSDSGELRLTKLVDLIRSSGFAIHDLSRMRAKEEGQVFRLNMAFELGLNYGHRSFSGADPPPLFLVLERERHDYMKALSDISGVDIKDHGDDPVRLVWAVRNWFVETVGVQRPPSGTQIWYDFNDFMTNLFEVRKEGGFDKENLHMMPIPELIDYMKEEAGK